MEEIIGIKGLKKSFGRLSVLKNISCSFEEGRVDIDFAASLFSAVQKLYKFWKCKNCTSFGLQKYVGRFLVEVERGAVSSFTEFVQITNEAVGMKLYFLYC